jgi:hypothetical protein
VITDEDPETVAERALARRPPGPASNQASSSVDAYLSAPATFIGSLDAIAERMYAVRERWNISYFTIGEAMAADAAPLIKRLTGK